MEPKILNNEGKNRTHLRTNSTLETTFNILKSKIIKRGDLPYISVTRQLDILSELYNFPLGRFILERGGTNGFWTDYMVNYPNTGRLSGLNIEGNLLSPLEDFFLNRCPIVVAHQERFQIFRNLIQSLLKENMILASIPCGLMRELLTLDFSKISKYSLIGLDIDSESLLLAAKLAENQQITNIRFIQQDAWDLNFKKELDLITSSGLNVYESNRKKVIELYKSFFNALKPGGILIISVLTFPPGEKEETDWDLSKINPEDLLLERVLHRDILNIKWGNFRSCQELASDFNQAGFTEISVHFDKCRIFPTIMAIKPIH